MSLKVRIAKLEAQARPKADAITILLKLDDEANADCIARHYPDGKKPPIVVCMTDAEMHCA
jgi:hypothetical protein